MKNRSPPKKIERRKMSCHARNPYWHRTRSTIHLYDPIISADGRTQICDLGIFLDELLPTRRILSTNLRPLHLEVELRLLLSLSVLSGFPQVGVVVIFPVSYAVGVVWSVTKREVQQLGVRFLS